MCVTENIINCMPCAILSQGRDLSAEMMYEKPWYIGDGMFLVHFEFVGNTLFWFQEVRDNVNYNNTVMIKQDR